jgi:2-oxoisovalerate dehydrogenase E1 component
MDRADIVHENFLRRVAARDFPVGAAPAGPLSPTDAVAIFRAACLSRALDRTSRAMQRAGQGFYTIGSSGHEGMAAVAMALRPTDMAFLHYRDAAFQIARGGQVPGQTMAWDMLLSFAASAEDPPRPSQATCPRPWERPIPSVPPVATAPNTRSFPMMRW